MHGQSERGADVVNRIGCCAYLIRRVVEQQRLALEPVLDRQGNFAKVVAPDYVLVPDNELESAHGPRQGEVDGEFESGILRRIDGVERSLDVRGLFSFTKKGDDYVAGGVEISDGRGQSGETYGSLLPLLSMARRSLQLQIWIFRLNAGCSFGWGPIGVATARDLRIGTTFAAPVTIAFPTRAGTLEDMLEDWDVVVAVRGGIRTVSRGGVEGCSVDGV